MIIVALPAYNEGCYIYNMVTECKKYADEVIVLNDGSTDDTELVAKIAGATVVSHDKNRGYGATIQSILAEARKRTFDAFIIIDADTQHYPSDIPSLVKSIIEGFDLVIGSRSHKDVPAYRYIGGKILSIFTRILSGENIKDSQSGFRAFSPKAVEVLMLKENGMAVSSEMVSEATKSGLRITEVPISIRYTDDSSSENPVVQGFYTLQRIAVMTFRRRISR